MDNLIQDFKFKFRPGTLAELLREKVKDCNVFTGSSYAIHFYGRLLARQSKRTVKKGQTKKTLNNRPFK
jgi:hypothetical protein